MAAEDVVVVVGVDASDDSEAAFSKAPKLLSSNAFFHIVVHGADLKELTVKDALLEHFNKEKVEKEKAEKAAALQQVKNKFTLLASIAGLRFTVVDRAGDLDVDLCTYCSVVNADMLFLPSHLGDSKSSLLHGTVAASCAKYAGCTVAIASGVPKKSALAQATESTTGLAKGAADGITGAAKGAAAGVKSLFIGSKEEKPAEESK